ncbi:MAG: hypothetical protein K5839_07995 [Treponemataceae bacterium]|nr:hypothetical protein [Treponemataceae bacterium]
MFNEYPRPQLVRNSYLNLNGNWLLNGSKIIVPYPPRSAFSEYQGKVGKSLLYQTKFELNNNFLHQLEEGKRMLLHFGAVDQIAQVYVDGNLAGIHKGGYLPFSFDITDYLSSSHYHELKVMVFDGLSHFFPYGKQSRKSHGMWYTQVSGIWQTVWAEMVSTSFISDLKITPQVFKDCQKLSIQFEVSQLNSNISENQHIEISIDPPDGKSIKKRINIEEIAEFEFTPEMNFKNWTPDTPHLYDFEVSLFQDDEEIDSIQSYFALRTISIDTSDGIPKFLLNGQKIFLNAVLDQGYFPEGIFLPENESGYKNDILNMKKLGFNTLRKHIKIEPEFFYYYCDKYGMMVMQDMVQNGSYNFMRDTAFPTLFGKKGSKKKIGSENKGRSKFSAKEEFFIEHSLNTISHLYNHPCIVYWTIFNEGWGQFATNDLFKIVKNADSSRIIDSASGWFKGAASDVESDHIYFKSIPLDKRLEECRKINKPLVISECGGFSLKVQDHNSNTGLAYGYGSCSDINSLTEKIKEMYEIMINPYMDKGLCGCVYTQLSDVENEINGLYTYDRSVRKVNLWR